MDPLLYETMAQVAEFYDQRKVGYQGPMGFRRTTDLLHLLNALCKMESRGLLRFGDVRFLDLGCGDGRVNVFMSYISAISVGIELEDWILEEFYPLFHELKGYLSSKGLLLPKDNIHLFLGDSSRAVVHEQVKDKIGLKLSDFDIFYTYLTMYREFGELVALKAKRGAMLWVYGISHIIPRLDGLEVLTNPSPLEGILCVYQKP